MYPGITLKTASEGHFLCFTVGHFTFKKQIGKYEMMLYDSPPCFWFWMRLESLAVFRPVSCRGNRTQTCDSEVGLLCQESALFHGRFISLSLSRERWWTDGGSLTCLIWFSDPLRNTRLRHNRICRRGLISPPSPLASNHQTTFGQLPTRSANDMKIKFPLQVNSIIAIPFRPMQCAFNHTGSLNRLWLTGGNFL